MEPEIDKAFDWLVLILAAIAAALCQFPELYPLKPEMGSLTLVRVLVFPMVVLAIVWLWSHLARKMEYKIVLKSFAWIYASFVLTADIMLLLMGTVRGPQFKSPAPGSPSFNPILQIISTLLFAVFPPIVFPILFCFFVIRPRFRELYKDSKFLYSLPQQALLYIIALTTYLLSIGILEGIL